MKEFHIDQANLEDTHAIASMIGKLLDEIMQSIDHQVFDFSEEGTVQLLKSLLENGRYVVFVAHDSDARLVGVITLVESCALYAGGFIGTIPEFYVDPGWRSQGVGTALVEAARSYAQLRGWKRLEVATPPLPQFARTLAFYERQGFEITGGRKLKLALPA